MSWTGTNPVTVGDPTKKKNYDVLWDNVDYIRTNVMSSGTIMIFGQNDAPTGWTLYNGFTNNSMLVYTTDATISGGGSDSPYGTHSHKWYYAQANNTTHGRTFNAAGSAVSLVNYDAANLGFNLISLSTEGSRDSFCSTGHTNKAFEPLYQKVIAATKDGY